MENFRNYYEILEVSQEATSEEIKQAYRRAARRYHPDVNPQDRQAEEKFKNIGEAYEVLSDPQKRSQYDQFSRYWKQKGFGGPAGRRSGDVLDYSQFADFNVFLDQLRSEPAPPARRPPRSPVNVRSRPAAAQDLKAQLTIPLERAYQGGWERIRLENGRSLEVNMPPGIADGQQIRLPGQGNQGGDLFLTVNLAPHPFYQLQGPDILCRVPVTPAEAVLGAQIEVPTLDGPVKMNLPAGVRWGQRLRLAKKGYPNQGERGDQIVELRIMTPTQISLKEQQLYSQLRQVETFNPRLELLAYIPARPAE